MKLGKSKSFTLLELVVVIVILGVLSALAIPYFVRTAEKAKGDGAIADLKLIYTGQKMYYNDHGYYGGSIGELLTYIEDPNRPNSAFDYIIVVFSDPPHYFFANAKRKSGMYANKYIRIDENERICGNWPWVEPCEEGPAPDEPAVSDR